MRRRCRTDAATVDRDDRLGAVFDARRVSNMPAAPVRVLC
jgi:hypothetical protein